MLIDAAEMEGVDPAAQNGSTDVTQVTRKKLPITVDEILGQVRQKFASENIDKSTLHFLFLPFYSCALHFFV